MIVYSGEIFDKVLYRNAGQMWNASFYVGSRTTINGELEQYVIGEDLSVEQVIPYNDSTAPLLLTYNQAPDKYIIKEKLQEKDFGDSEDSELSFDMIYTVLEACIRKNNMYNFSYFGGDLLIEEAIKSPLNRDMCDRAMYVLHNGGRMKLSRIETPKSFKKNTICDFDRENIFKIMNHLYQIDPEFQGCFDDIVTDTEGLVTPVSSHNYIIDTIVTEEISWEDNGTETV